jgi:Spy/CpxP family protein refolding chaperone
MIVLLVSIAAPTIMYAAQMGGIWHKPCITRWDLFKLMRDIKITDQQKTDLKDIGMQTITDIQPIVQQMDALRKQMTATFLASEIDTAQAESQISEMIELNSQIADIMLHAKLQEAQVLTPEQRATLLEFTTRLDQCIEDLGKIPSLFPDLAK